MARIYADKGHMQQIFKAIFNILYNRIEGNISLCVGIEYFWEDPVIFYHLGK